MHNVAQRQVALTKAAFTLSLDLELMWGTLDRPYSESFRKLCQVERDIVIDRLLDLFTEYRISATWAVVGNLFRDDGGDPMLRGREMIRKIRQCPVPQEIGCHTLSHTIMADRNCTPAMAEREFGESVRIAAAEGLRLTSLVFPRNRIAYLEVARRAGFTCYRGEEPHWYLDSPGWVRRAGHMLDILTARTPPAVWPRYENGIWNVPGSMLFTPSFGTRRLVPVKLRVLRAKRGLRRAVKQRGIFHLWFHPTDLVVRMPAMLGGLREVLEEVARLREQGKLEVRPMKAFVPPAFHEAGAMSVNA